MKTLYSDSLIEATLCPDLSAVVKIMTVKVVELTPKDTQKLIWRQRIKSLVNKLEEEPNEDEAEEESEEEQLEKDELLAFDIKI